MSKPNRQHVPRAASFKRIAKALRVRARNHTQAAKIAGKAREFGTKCHQSSLAAAFKGFAYELDAEAKLLRSMR